MKFKKKDGDKTIRCAIVDGASCDMHNIPHQDGSAFPGTTNLFFGTKNPVTIQYYHNIKNKS